MELQKFLLRYDQDNAYLYLEIPGKKPLFLTNVKDLKGPTHEFFLHGNTLMGRNYIVIADHISKDHIQIELASGNGGTLSMGYCLNSDIKNKDIPGPLDLYLNTEWDNLYPDIAPN